MDEWKAWRKDSIPSSTIGVVKGRSRLKKLKCHFSARRCFHIKQSERLLHLEQTSDATARFWELNFGNTSEDSTVLGKSSTWTRCFLFGRVWRFVDLFWGKFLLHFRAFRTCRITYIDYVRRLEKIEKTSFAALPPRGCLYVKPTPLAMERDAIWIHASMNPKGKVIQVTRQQRRNYEKVEKLNYISRTARRRKTSPFSFRPQAKTLGYSVRKAHNLSPVALWKVFP